MSGLFVIAIAVVGWMLYQKYFRALLAQGRPGQIRIAIIVLGLVFLLLAVTGRASPVFAAIGGLMAMAMRLLPVLLKLAPWLSRSLGVDIPGMGGQVSQVRTNTLVMSIYPDTGAMHGKVLLGEFEGRVLDALSDDELQRLHEYCRRQDVEGLRLLESWLVRERPEAWGAKPGTAGPGGAGSGAAAGGSGMNVDEACEVLGVEATATRDEIVTAHRSLMVRLHPDKGGSHYLSAKVNEAKRVLMDRLA